MLNSLTNQKDFNIFKLQGSKIVSKCFVTIYIKKELLPARSNYEGLVFAIKATKKLGNSVKRNKIKRLIRHILRDIYTSFPESCDIMAYLIIPRAKIFTTSFNLVSTDFLTVIKKIQNG